MKLDLAALRSWLSQPRPMLINGKWVQARSGKTFEVQAPATEMHLATVAEGDADRCCRQCRGVVDAITQEDGIRPPRLLADDFQFPQYARRIADHG